MRNWAQDPAHVAVRDRMEAKLAEWMKRTGDSWANDSMASVEDNGRLYRFKAFYTIREYQEWAAKHPDAAPRE